MAADSPATRKETDLWLLERLVPGSGVNNLSLTFDVDGHLDADLLERALTLVVRKFDILRTVFLTTETDLTKRVVPPSEAGVDVLDMAMGDAGDVQAAVESFVGAPFVLDGSPLVRAAVFRHGGSDTVSVALHHLVFDAMSTVTLLGELMAAYGDPEGYDTTAVAPAAEPEPSAESVEFWREQLRGFRPDEEGGLWIGNPPSAAPDLAGESTWYSLSPEARAVVRRLQREVRAPEAVILLAAYYLLLSRHGAGSDIVVGSPVSVRPQGHESAIGYHVNVLPLRVKVDAAKPFKRLVNRARAIFLEGLGNSGVPAESVLDEVRAEGPSWRNSLCNHLFNYVPGGTSGSFSFGGHQARTRQVENGFSKFDLEFFFMPEGEEENAETKIRAVYRTQAFSRADVALLLDRYDALLVALGEGLDQPVGELSVWSAADRAAVEAGHRDGRLPEAFAASPAAGRYAVYGPGSEGVRAFVAAPDGGELPVGVRGELCVVDEERVVRTGDLARWLADGRLQLLGRVERRVRVQGLAFGLEELDSVLLAHPAVDGAATVAVPGGEGGDGPVLVSFVAADPQPDLPELLAKHVAAELPAPAEPRHVVVVDELPSVGGRPDLKGLRRRAEELVRGASSAAAEDQGLDTEELTRELLALWREFLKRDDLKSGSGFFASGGHSLLGVQLIQRVKRSTGVQVKIRLADLFANPTPEKLASFIAQKAGAAAQG
ncbi:hypothetical protein GCM10020000_52980 [Streptomyces olivoverticillatus]